MERFCKAGITTAECTQEAVNVDYSEGSFADFMSFLGKVVTTTGVWYNEICANDEAKEAFINQTLHCYVRPQMWGEYQQIEQELKYMIAGTLHTQVSFWLGGQGKQDQICCALIFKYDENFKLNKEQCADVEEVTDCATNCEFHNADL